MTLRELLHRCGIVFDNSFELSGPTIHTKVAPVRQAKTDVIGDVSDTGTVTNVTHDAETNTFTWADVKSKVGKNVRSSQIDVYDQTQIKIHGLDATRYEVFKKVWADGIGAEKAGNDTRIEGMTGISRAYRKEYWKAMNAAEDARNAPNRVGGNPSPTTVFEW